MIGEPVRVGRCHRFNETYHDTKPGLKIGTMLHDNSSALEGMYERHYALVTKQPCKEGAAIIAWRDWSNRETGGAGRSNMLDAWPHYVERFLARHGNVRDVAACDSQIKNGDAIALFCL